VVIRSEFSRLAIAQFNIVPSALVVILNAGLFQPLLAFSIHPNFGVALRMCKPPFLSKASVLTPLQHNALVYLLHPLRGYPGSGKVFPSLPETGREGEKSLLSRLFSPPSSYEKGDGGLGSEC
jgi:hypothetical protein